MLIIEHISRYMIIIRCEINDLKIDFLSTIRSHSLVGFTITIAWCLSSTNWLPTKPDSSQSTDGDMRGIIRWLSVFGAHSCYVWHLTLHLSVHNNDLFFSCYCCKDTVWLSDGTKVWELWTLEGRKGTMKSMGYNSVLELTMVLYWSIHIHMIC